MPQGAVYVGRPTEWGNPFTGPDAVEHYRLWMTGEFVPGMPGRQVRAGEARHPNGMAVMSPGEIVALFLGGKDLACWCPLEQPCHADVLLELANPECSFHAETMPPRGPIGYRMATVTDDFVRETGQNQPPSKRLVAGSIPAGGATFTHETGSDEDRWTR